MMTGAGFVATIEGFLSDTGMRAATFGRRAVGDPKFVFDLREGRSPSLAVVERVQDFIANYQPDQPAPADPAPQTRVDAA